MEGESIQQLETRKLVAQSIIYTLTTYEQDNRTKDALAHYKKQLQSIENQIKNLKNSKDIVIGLKPAPITAIRR